MKTQTIAKGAVLLGIFFVASNIIPPIHVLGTPFTFQTLVILIVPFLFNFKEMILWYFSLLLLCLIGFPIMSGFSGGFGVLLGPTAGFIYGWLFMMVLTKCGQNFFDNNLSKFTMMFLGTVVDILGGALWFSLLSGGDLLVNTKVFVVSFLPFGIVKIIITLQIVKRIPARFLGKGGKIIGTKVNIK